MITETSLFTGDQPFRNFV